LDGRSGQRYVSNSSSSFRIRKLRDLPSMRRLLFAFELETLSDAALRLITRVDSTNFGLGDDDPERRAA